MTQKEIIKKLVEKYIKIYGNGWSYECDDKENTQLDLLDDIFEECFNIKDLYVDNRWLMSGGKRIG